ncbi:MAG: hypothetical protein HYX79_08740 [Chloroflexi bacterium]|nr:hypothetical protein [Chloroflexota bacterium]
MRNKYKSVICLVICAIVLAFVAAANINYPAGETYIMNAEKYNTDLIERDSAHYSTEPSPKSNPGWVRFLQDNPLIGIVFGFGAFACLVNLAGKERIEKVP